jgi:hypothetical protein
VDKIDIDSLTPEMEDESDECGPPPAKKMALDNEYCDKKGNRNGKDEAGSS